MDNSGRIASQYIDNMKKINHQIVSDMKKSGSTNKNGGVQPQEPVDIYAGMRAERNEMSRKSFPKGSHQKVLEDTTEMMERLRPFYNKAKDDSEYASKIGDKQRSRIIRQQYMEEHFLPVVDALVRLDNIDMVLNAPKVLAMLDGVVLLDGGIAGNGYTASYLNSMYGELKGQFCDNSDPIVAKQMKTIRRLMECDEVRTAIGVANKLKKQIDNGEHTASEEDYSIIQNIVLRGL